jgi:hypothetical protein
MEMKIKLRPRSALFALAIASIAAAGQAQAITFTASGTAGDGRPDNGQVDFSFNATYTDLLVTLTNTAGAGQLGGISSVLDGVKFTLSGVALSALSLNTAYAAASFDPNGTVNCTGASCVTNAAPVSVTTSGWTYATTGLLSAGNGSFKPYGIVNTNLAHTDGIPNAQHNPYLEGPVTFDFSITNPSNAAISVTSANLYFGTVPDIHAGVATVPEAGTWAMMMAGLGLVGLQMRRRKPGPRMIHA